MRSQTHIALCTTHLGAMGFWLVFQLPKIGHDLRMGLRAVFEPTVNLAPQYVRAMTMGIGSLFIWGISYAYVFFSLQAWHHDYAALYAWFPEDILRPMSRRFVFVYLCVAAHVVTLATLFLRAAF